jgi:hypothetical protein
MLKDPIFIQKPPKLFSGSVNVSDDNFLSASRFVFVVDTPDLKNLSFHCQTVSIPSMSAQNVEVPVRQYVPQMTSDRIIYDPFDATFLVDEKLENFKAVQQWLIDSVTSNVILKRDLSLLIYNNSNIHSQTLRFVGAFPTSLSPIPFVANASDTTYMASSVSFAIDYYYFDLAS